MQSQNQTPEYRTTVTTGGRGNMESASRNKNTAHQCDPIEEPQRQDEEEDALVDVKPLSWHGRFS